MQEEVAQTKEQEQSPRAETLHEPHPHARSRILWGIAAVCVVGAGLMVWSRWGAQIREACLGTDGACPVELEDVPADGASFDPPEGFE